MKDLMIDRQLSVMCHIFGLLTNILTPLVFFITKKNDAAFLRHHETEALNFQITILLFMIIAIYLDFSVCKNIYFIPCVIIMNISLSILAALKAREDIFFKYPIIIPFFKNKTTAFDSK